MATSRAEDAGLTHRPFADVVRDTLAWAQAHPDQATDERWGLAPDVSASSWPPGPTQA